MNDGGDKGNVALHCACSEELLLYCKSESLSVEGLREIFERHGWTPNNTQHISADYEFFCAACRNEIVNEEIIRCLLEYFPDAAGTVVGDKGSVALHCACKNKNVTPGIIRILIDATSTSVRCEDNDGWTPLHYLCNNENLDETVSLQILKLLIEKCPEAVRHANRTGGSLPIHLASRGKSPEYCRVLIEAYPQTEQIPNNGGALLLHLACLHNTVHTVEYLYRLYPDAIDHETPERFYPIHCAIYSTMNRDCPAAAVDIVQFLLDCDPNVKLQLRYDLSLLYYACNKEYNDSSIDAGIQIIEVIFDSRPLAIEDFRIREDIELFHHQVQAFINGELVYARQARDLRLMNTPDDNGQLPLHTALQNNVRLGSIKLLVEGNPSAFRNVDINFAMPLHIACEHHDSAAVVQYVLNLDTRTLRAVDIDNNTALHYACRGAKHDSIALLLETYDAASVSKTNTDGKLPIEVLWESNEVNDRESVEYMGSVFQLLRAYPELLAISNWTEKQSVDVDAARHGKKRKSSSV